MTIVVVTNMECLGMNGAAGSSGRTARNLWAAAWMFLVCAASALAPADASLNLYLTQYEVKRLLGEILRTFPHLETVFSTGCRRWLQRTTASSNAVTYDAPLQPGRAGLQHGSSMAGSLHTGQAPLLLLTGSIPRRAAAS